MSESQKMKIKTEEDVFKKLFERREIINNNNHWDALMMEIHRRSEMTMMEKDLTCHVGVKEMERNRSFAVLPFDYNRQKVSKSSGNPAGYLNASRVKVPEAKTKYIMAASPLNTEYPYFWKMVMEKKPQVIILLSQEMYNRIGRSYYPKELNDARKYGECFVKCEKMEVENAYVFRQFSVKSFGIMGRLKIHHLHHYQFLHWTDQGVPRDTEEFVQFYDMIVQKGVFNPCSSKKPIIQCKAGVGRTGTFIIIDSLIRMIDRHVANDYCIEQEVLALRKQRILSVSVKEQLRFIYDFLIFYLEKRNPQFAQHKTALKFYAKTAEEVEDIDIYFQPGQHQWGYAPREEWIKQYYDGLEQLKTIEEFAEFYELFQ